FTDGVVFRIASHADHLHPFVSAEKLESLADRVLVGPEALGCALIDHRDFWAVFTNRAVKAAATQDGNAHGLQVVRGNAVHLRKHAGAVQNGIAATQKYAAPNTAIHQGYAAGKRGFLHARSRLHNLEYTTLKLFDARRFVVQRADVERDHAQVMSLEPGIGLLSVAQTRQEEPGADQRHQREHDLQHDKEIAQAEAAAGAGLGAGALLQFGDQIGARGLQRRRQPKEHAGRERDGEIEQEHAMVERQAEVAVGEKRRPEIP